MWHSIKHITDHLSTSKMSLAQASSAFTALRKFAPQRPSKQVQQTITLTIQALSSEFRRYEAGIVPWDIVQALSCLTFFKTCVQDLINVCSRVASRKIEEFSSDMRVIVLWSFAKLKLIDPNTTETFSDAYSRGSLVGKGSPPSCLSKVAWALAVLGRQTSPSFAHVLSMIQKSLADNAGAFKAADLACIASAISMSDPREHRDMAWISSALETRAIAIECLTAKHLVSLCRAKALTHQEAPLLLRALHVATKGATHFLPDILLIALGIEYTQDRFCDAWSQAAKTGCNRWTSNGIVMTLDALSKAQDNHMDGVIDDIMHEAAQRLYSPNEVSTLFCAAERFFFKTKRLRDSVRTFVILLFENHDKEIQSIPIDALWCTAKLGFTSHDLPQLMQGPRFMKVNFDDLDIHERCRMLWAMVTLKMHPSDSCRLAATILIAKLNDNELSHFLYATWMLSNIRDADRKITCSYCEAKHMLSKRVARLGLGFAVQKIARCEDPLVLC